MSTLYSSFNAGISGLNANATRLSVISDNIANTGTLGYKRAVTSFHSMVMGGSHYGPYIAGGARATTSRLVDERGSLTTSSNPTDLAISGRGFLPVTTPAAAASGTVNPPLMLATTGSFRPDAEGLLRTPAGHALLGWPASLDGTIGTFPRDSAGGLQAIRVNDSQFVSDPTTTMNLRANLPSTATQAGQAVVPYDMSLEYYTPLGLTQTLNIRFEPVVPAAGSSNQWTAVITNPADANAVLGEYTLAFTAAGANAGRLAGVTQAVGAPGGAYDPGAGELSVTVGGQAIAINIGQPNVADALTQMSNTFLPVEISRNGSPVQSLIGVEVDAGGILRGIYDSGMIRVIAQIPLVDVPNPNGLQALDNQLFRVSPESGSMFLWNAGEGPTGSMVSYAREESATDIAAELTNMIQTQRAYSSNAKVIQTVDEMLQETTNIKR